MAWQAVTIGTAVVLAVLVLAYLLVPMPSARRQALPADADMPEAVEPRDSRRLLTGPLLLLGVAIAAGLDLPASPDDGGWPHLLVEAARAAAYDRPDQLFEGADVRPLFAPDEVARRRALIYPDRRAALVSPAAAGDTMYLCAVDHERMGVSLIQSNAKGFGCNVFEPTTGIGLHNRGIGFSLEAGHPAGYGPGRRPPHTLAPTVVTRPDGSVCGIVTDRDLALNVVAEGSDPTSMVVRDVCNHTVESVESSDPVGKAVKMMSGRAIRRLPVIDDGRLVGIVTLGDLAMERDPGSALASISEAPPNN